MKLVKLNLKGQSFI